MMTQVRTVVTFCGRVTGGGERERPPGVEELCVVGTRMYHTYKSIKLYPQHVSTSLCVNYTSTESFKRCV